MMVIWFEVIVEKVVWLNLGHILKVELMGLTDEFDTGLEEKSQGSMLDFCPE